MMARIAFISGHVDLSQAEFQSYYSSAIDQALNDGDHFVIGSARGADSYALKYLIAKNIDPQKITVYLYEKNPNRVAELAAHYHQLKIKLRDGYNSCTSRDAQMTRDSSYDIAWVRPE